jgi:hypothetical protein
MSEDQDRIVAGLHQLGLDDHEVEEVMALMRTNRLTPEPEPPAQPMTPQQHEDAKLLEQLRGANNRWTHINGWW